MAGKEKKSGLISLLRTKSPAEQAGEQIKAENDALARLKRRRFGVPSSRPDEPDLVEEVLEMQKGWAQEGKSSS